MIYVFEGCELDGERLELRRDGEPVPVQPKVFELLAYLVERPDRVISRRELLDSLWPDVAVTDHVLTRCVSEARKAIGTGPGSEPAIRTLSGRGYRFVAPVEARGAPASSASKLCPPALAVLPFDCLSGGPSATDFARGLVEELTTHLAVDAIPGLRTGRGFDVVARTSAEQASQDGGPVREIAGKLGARYAIEGSVRFEGDRVRVAVQLIDARSDLHVWAQNFDQPASDALAAQDEISQAIVGSMSPALGRHETGLAERKPFAELSAWDCVVRGNAMLDKLDAEATSEARAMFGRALELDPGSAWARAYLAFTHHLEFTHQWTDDPSASLDALESEARGALQLNSREPLAHVTLGLAFSFRGYREGSIAHFERAVELAPTWPAPREPLALMLASCGRPSEALEHVEMGLRYADDDPTEATLLYAKGAACFALGDYIGAVIAARESIKRQPNTPFVRGVLVAALALLGDTDTARAEFRELPPFSERLFRDTLVSCDPAFVDRVVDGLRAAGMGEDADDQETRTSR